VNTHDDGRSRLFLVGPRHSKFLVPATCRSCLDPVCMIGCPVNSIQRGDNKEIVIRDWCIGCFTCADQCPYGSIQMHDTGLVPAVANDWRFAPAPADEAWTLPGFDSRSWAVGATPFTDDTFLEQVLAGLRGHAPRGPVAFRRTFALAAADCAPGASLHLNLLASDTPARVWVNAIELQTDDRPRQVKTDFFFPPGTKSLSYPLNPVGKYLRPGDNALAVLVPRPANAIGQAFFTLRLDAEQDSASAAVEIKQVTALAVVCDLCSKLPTGPACVTACPHEAAMRINAVAAGGA
jgi:Fe-S-cluster-containing hydrogenase component 2